MSMGGTFVSREGLLRLLVAGVFADAGFRALRGTGVAGFAASARGPGFDAAGAGFDVAFLMSRGMTRLVGTAGAGAAVVFWGLYMEGAGARRRAVVVK